MGIRFFCPNGHKLNVKEHLAGKRGVCPQCGAKFIIPLPTDLQATDDAQPASVGQSQSIEIALSPMNPPSAVAAAAPSAIIPVTEADLAPPPAAPSARGPEVVPDDALPASILGSQPPIQPEPSVSSADAVYSSEVGRSRRNQILVSLLLFALVIVLAGVLIWVLKRETTSVPTEKKTANIDPAPRTLRPNLGA